MVNSFSQKVARLFPSRPSWGYGCVLVFIVLIVYLPALDAGFIWDDDDYVTDNMTLRSVDGLRAMWTEKGAIPQYYPLTHTTFWLEYQCWGLNPVGYHAVNILLHALGCILLWRCLGLLGVPGAWFIALLFGVHPVHVESVAWITERKNVLSALFYFASFEVYWRYYTRAGGWQDSAVSIWNKSYAAAFLLFACALLSKTVTCSLPAAILLLIWRKKGHLTLRDVTLLIPYFILGAALAWITVHLEKTMVYAVGAEWDYSLVNRVLIAGKAVWFYAFKLVWPSPLTFFYPRWNIDAGNWILYLYPGALLVGLCALWRYRSRLGRGPLVAVLYFCGTLFPALGFFDVYPMRYSLVADHFQYLASIGMLALSVSFVIRARQTLWPDRFFVESVPGGILVLVLGLLTWRQTHVYKDIETLWNVTIERNPSAWAAHNNLGLLYHQRGDLDAAIQHYREAYAINPQGSEILVNLGIWHADRKEDEQAILWYKRALELRPDDPNPYYNLGNVRLHSGQYAEAIDLYQRALALRPDDSRIWTNLAQAYFKVGNITRAEQLYRQILGQNTGSADDPFNLGIVLEQQGRYMEAEELFRAALTLNPNHTAAQLRWAEVLIKLNRQNEGITELQRLGKSVNDAQTALQIGAQLAQQKAYEEASHVFEHAIVLDATFAPAYFALANLYVLQGREREAVDHYRRAIERAPEWPGPANNLAWLLATSADPRIRDGVEALRWATFANERTDYAEHSYLNTLAAAYAAVGQFPEAIRWMRELIEKNKASDENVDEYQRRLTLYEAGTPFQPALPAP